MTYDDEIHAGVADDQLSPGIVQPRGIQARSCQACNGVRIQRALRHRNAQRAVLVVARQVQRLHDLLQVEREAGSGTRLAVRGKHLVVATAAS